jgi:hypothetical protein
LYNSLSKYEAWYCGSRSSAWPAQASTRAAVGSAVSSLGGLKSTAVIRTKAESAGNNIAGTATKSGPLLAMAK